MQARRAIRPFENAVLPRLPGWAEDFAGPASERLENLSGGAWRDDLDGPRPPSWMALDAGFLRLAYAGFQLGYWTFAAADGDAPAEAERRRWAGRLTRLA